MAVPTKGHFYESHLRGSGPSGPSWMRPFMKVALRGAAILNKQIIKVVVFKMAVPTKGKFYESRLRGSGPS
eukprot:1038087-Heterocapsa_arctica.AAC.1